MITKENYPELFDKVVIVTLDNIDDYFKRCTEKLMEQKQPMHNQYEFIDTDDVETHCKDNQRIREAIEKVRTRLSKEHTGMRLFTTLLYKELNLEWKVIP